MPVRVKTLFLILKQCPLIIDPTRYVLYLFIMHIHDTFLIVFFYQYISLNHILMMLSQTSFIFLMFSGWTSTHFGKISAKKGKILPPKR